MIYFEKITLLSMFRAFFLIFVKNKIKNIKIRGIYYFFDSKYDLILIKIIFKIFKIKVLRLNFNFKDIKIDEKYSGHILPYTHIQDFIDSVYRNEKYKEFLLDKSYDEYFVKYLKKTMTYTDGGGMIKYTNSRGLFYKIFMINVVNWHSKNHKEKALIVLNNSPWVSEFVDYANNFSINLLNINNHLEFVFYFTKEFYHKMKNFIRNIFLIENKLMNTKIKNKDNNLKLIVQTYHCFNLLDQSKTSDIFYCNNSIINNNNILIYPANNYWIRKEHFNEIKIARMHAINVNPITDKGKFKKFIDIYKFVKNFKNYSSSNDRGSILNYKNDFSDYKESYMKFFLETNSKVHVTHFKFTNEHIAINSAMKEIGGISAMWQSSAELVPCYELAMTSDVYFSFSPQNAEIERKNGSKISYHIATGYPGDYRFKLQQKESLKIRDRLIKNGSKKIIAFFDENSAFDERWWEGNSVVCESYAFFLEKLLSDSSLGIIFKPKKSTTIFKRLEKIEDLIKKANNTGRCYFIMTDMKNSCPSFSPAIASYASDIAISSSAVSGTAAVESALTGTPTLILDHYNWKLSKLYELGEGRVIFNKLEDMWQAISNQFKTNNLNQELGNWEPIINDFDPFRDGKAHLRISKYLNQLLDGFKKGKDRDTILADVSEEYSREWGADKVTYVN